MEHKIEIAEFKLAKYDLRELESDFNQAKSRLKKQEVELAYLLTNNSIKIGDLFSVGTIYRYKVKDIRLSENDFNDSYAVYVWGIRVDKKTNEVISSKYDSIAYATEFDFRRIKEIIKQPKIQYHLLKKTLNIL